jgi:hypothetical protein
MQVIPAVPPAGALEAARSVRVSVSGRCPGFAQRPSPPMCRSLEDTNPSTRLPETETRGANTRACGPAHGGSSGPPRRCVTRDILAAAARLSLVADGCKC